MNKEAPKNNNILIIIAIIGAFATICAAAIGAFATIYIAIKPVSTHDQSFITQTADSGLPTTAPTDYFNSASTTQQPTELSSSEFMPTQTNNGYLFSEDFEKKPNWDLSGVNFSITNGRAVAENGSLGTPLIGNSEWKNYAISLKMDCFDCMAITVYVRAKNSETYMAYMCLEVTNSVYQDDYSCFWAKSIDGDLKDIITTKHTFEYIWNIVPIYIEAGKDNKYSVTFADGTMDTFIDTEEPYFTEGAFGLFITGGSPAIDSIQVVNLP